MESDFIDLRSLLYFSIVLLAIPVALAGLRLLTPRGFFNFLSKIYIVQFAFILLLFVAISIGIIFIQPEKISVMLLLSGILIYAMFAISGYAFYRSYKHRPSGDSWKDWLLFGGEVLFVLTVTTFLINLFGSKSIVINSIIALIGFAVLFVMETNNYIDFIPNYSNWDEAYEKLKGKEIDVLGPLSISKGIEQFQKDYERTKKAFAEEIVLENVRPDIRNAIFTCFSHFDSLIKDEMITFFGSDDGKTFMLKTDYNYVGEKCSYTHLPYRNNVKYGMKMRQGRIDIGGTYLRFGLCDYPSRQFWQICDGNWLIGIDGKRGIVEERKLK